METGKISLDDGRRRILVAIAVLLPLLLWNLLCWKPLMHNDTSEYLFKIANGEVFFLPHQRFSDALTQFIPLSLVRLGVDFSAVVLGYMANIAFFYMVIGGILFVDLRSEKHFLHLALLVYAGFALSLYWPIDEEAMGFALLVLVRGLSQKEPGSTLYAACGGLAALAACFFHPVVAVGVAGLFALSIVENRKLTHAGFGLIGALALYAFFKFLTIQGMEGDRVGVSASVVLNHASDLLRIAEKMAPLYVPLLGLCCYAYWRGGRGEGAPVAGWLSAVMGVVITLLPLASELFYPNADWYRSHMLIPTMFFLSMATTEWLYWKVMPGVGRWGPAVIAMVLAVAVMWSQGNSFRLSAAHHGEYIELARAQGVRLGYFNSENHTKIRGTSYANGVESLVRSAIDGPGKAVSYVDDCMLGTRLGLKGSCNVAPLLKQIDGRFVMTDFEDIPIAKLNRKYFELVGEQYRMINVTQ